MDADQIDCGEAVAELSAAFRSYEAALIRHDVEALDSFFWSDSEVVRYGIAETNVGIDAIRAFRRAAEPVNPGRQLRGTVVRTFGRSFGTVSTEFAVPGDQRVGRQSQTWVRMGGVWRIVAAHVSLVDPPPT